MQWFFGKRAHHKEILSIHADGFPSTLVLIPTLPCCWTPPPTPPLLLLLQDLGIGGVHGGRPLVLLLVRGDVLVVLELLHLWLQLLGLAQDIWCCLKLSYSLFVLFFFFF